MSNPSTAATAHVDSVEELLREYLADGFDVRAEDDNLRRAAHQVTSLINTLLSGDYVDTPPVDYDYRLPTAPGRYKDAQDCWWMLMDGLWYYGEDRREPNFTDDPRSADALWSDGISAEGGSWFPFTRVDG